MSRISQFSLGTIVMSPCVDVHYVTVFVEDVDNVSVITNVHDLALITDDVQCLWETNVVSP